MAYRSREEIDQFFIEDDRQSLLMRVWLWVSMVWRPHLGWSVLSVCILLAMLPTMALRANDWVRLGSSQSVLDLAGPLAVITGWLVMGWKRPAARTSRWRGFLKLVALTFVGAWVISELLVGWLPGPALILRVAMSGAWVEASNQILTTWTNLFARYGLWWQGVQAGGAAQDNLVFAGLASVSIWIAGALTAWLARRFQQGLVASVPTLWLLSTILLYSSTGRMLMITGLTLAILLQLLLDHERLMARWQRLNLDFNPGLFVDRLAAALSAAVLVFLVAAITPNLYYLPLVEWYYGIISPVNQELEDTAERLFPDIEATSRRRAGLASGLPNDFLLGSGPELSSIEMMRVRTNDTGGYDYPFDEEIPPGHYIRGGTLTVYDGLGWSNPANVEITPLAADIPLVEETPPGRKLLVQSVQLTFTPQVAYAAPEPIEFSTEVRAAERAAGDMVSMRSRERSYTVISAIPALSEETLAAAQGWGEEFVLPPEYEAHLALPDTVTERTRQVAEEVTAGLDSPYAKAAAIEAYLRGFEYDLGVPQPPDEVTDVADYFLFDLQRGYCDYYATAFVVMARHVGLPTRFATGFAVGRWEPLDAVWVITEAEAHSWPEVYFPEYGWIPFEPTAGRPSLLRVGLPEAGTATGFVPSAATTETIDAPGVEWNWQVLVWLPIIAVVVWGVAALVIRFRKRQDDPWQGLLAWGRKIGRPLDEGETVLEYGRNLASFLIDRQTGTADTGRVVAREVQALSSEVSTARYGPDRERERSLNLAQEHWQRLRGYRRSIRVERG